MGSPISSPGDTWYQGRGTRPTDIELGKTKTTKSQDKLIESLMQKRLQVMRNKKNNDVNA